ncbi:MAG: rod shape determining protein RodA, partial [Actinomycetota bacterium]|nr:rod shape determining protein RodA [Actinomycetota bacterium]
MAVSETSPWRHADGVLLALPFAISGLGLLMIYSSSRTRLARQGVSQLYYVERQSLAIVLGVIAMAAVLAIDYRRVRDLWPLVYLAVLPLLIGVLVTGQRHKGAQSWFQVGPLQFQPSEITKVAVVIAIAGFAMALVFLQHDLGTTLVILVCSFAVLVVAGLKPAHIGVLVLIGVTLVGAAVVTGKVAAYRVDRIVGFLDQSTGNKT